MAPIIENWTEIEGKVKSVRDVSEPAGHAVAEIAVTKATAVEGFASLLGDSVGKVMDVHIRKGSSAEIKSKIGATVQLRLRRAGPDKIYAHPGTP